MVQTRGKIIEKSNFTLQPLPLSSKKISVFFNFFEFLDAYLRSLLICENHKSELYFTISDYFYHCVLGTLVLFISMVNSQFYFFQIATTWRSGSTFLGDILLSHPATFYHYEPLINYKIHQVRDGTPLAPKAIKALENLFKCDYSDLGNLV